MRFLELKCTLFLQSNNFIPWHSCCVFESSAMSATWMSLPLTEGKVDFYQYQTCHFWICCFERLFSRCGETACSCIFFSASYGKCINNNVSVKSWIFIIKTLQRCICKYDIFKVSRIDLTWANEEKRMAQNTTSTYNLFNTEQSFSRTNIYINIPQSDKNKFTSGTTNQFQKFQHIIKIAYGIPLRALSEELWKAVFAWWHSISKHKQAKKTFDDFLYKATPANDMQFFTKKQFQLVSVRLEITCTSALK